MFTIPIPKVVRMSFIVAQGGEATSEEMCLAFSLYYPRPADGNVLDACVSFPDSQTSFNHFLTTLARSVNYDFYHVVSIVLLLPIYSIDPAAATMFANPNTSLAALNSLDWRGDSRLATALEYSVRNSEVNAFCSTIKVSHPL